MTDPDGSPVRVLFVVGKGRSGSTLLDNILGEIPGVFSTGELIHLWDWGVSRAVRCGCGEDVFDCPVWSKVLAQGFGIHSRDTDNEKIEAIVRDYKTIHRWREVPRLFTRRSVGRWSALRRHVTRSEILLRTIADVTGAQVVVDSSKTPLSPAALGLVDGVDGAVVHLVRDPRAVAFSWQRTKEWADRDEGATMPRHPAIQSAASWIVRNIGAEVVVRRWPRDRTMRLRYEDFTREPRAAIARVTELIGLSNVDLPFTDERTALLGPNHTVGGNPNRMRSGATTIQLDDAWEDQLDGRSRHLLSTLTRPLRHRYGYTSRVTSDDQ